MTGYNINGIEPGTDGWTGSQITDLLENTTPIVPAVATRRVLTHNTAYDFPTLYGWSLRNTFAGLSTVFIRFGEDAAATPFIAVNLAENETVTQIFEDGIPGGAPGFFVTVQVGSVTGLLYTS